jgi:hypothetical protein
VGDQEDIRDLKKKSTEAVTELLLLVLILVRDVKNLTSEGKQHVTGTSFLSAVEFVLSHTGIEAIVSDLLRSTQIC